MNIGGPQKLTGPQVAETLSEVLGFKLKYDPYTPEEFGEALVDALHSNMSGDARRAFVNFISDFYHYNNSAPTTPFSVNEEYMRERLPEIQLETLHQWASRQDWGDSADRPSGG